MWASLPLAAHAPFAGFVATPPLPIGRTLAPYSRTHATSRVHNPLFVGAQPAPHLRCPGACPARHTIRWPAQSGSVQALSTPGVRSRPRPPPGGWPTPVKGARAFLSPWSRAAPAAAARRLGGRGGGRGGGFTAHSRVAAWPCAPLPPARRPDLRLRRHSGSRGRPLRGCGACPRGAAPHRRRLRLPRQPGRTGAAAGAAGATAARFGWVGAPIPCPGSMDAPAARARASSTRAALLKRGARRAKVQRPSDREPSTTGAGPARSRAPRRPRPPPALPSRPPPPLPRRCSRRGRAAAPRPRPPRPLRVRGRAGAAAAPLATRTRCVPAAGRGAGWSLAFS
jgi:hypothetical protein